MPKRVLLRGPMLHPVGEEVLRKEVEIVDGGALTGEAAERALARVHGIFVAGPLTGEQMDRAPVLEVIGFPGSGFEAIDVAAATERGIVVVYAAGSQYSAVAEHAVGLMLSLAKRIGYADRALHRDRRYLDRHVFSGDGWPGFPHEIGGKTLGILGFGFIGRDLARKARAAFDMQVLAYDPYYDPVEAARQGVELFRRRSELPSLFDRSDFVVLCLPLNDETRHIVGAEELRRLGASSYLVNVSRGGTVDEEALVKALREGWIAGAGIDVFDEEPTRDDHPLFDIDTAVLTPHIGGWVEEALPRLAGTAAREMLTALRGERPDRLANPAVWDAPHRRVQGGSP